MKNFTGKMIRVKKAFEKVAHSDTDWSYAADLFVGWVLENDFECESFKGFVEWISDDQIDDIWRFFFGYGNDFEKFAEDWVDEDEADDYLEYCRARE